MQLHNPLRAICPTLEADVLMALVDGRRTTPGQLIRERGIQASVSGARRCLERLEANGIVIALRVGNRTEYALNPRHMLAAVVAEASRGTERFIEFLIRAISDWPEQPLQVTLFGSAARREMRSDSDIDLLFVIPDGASDELYELIGDLAVDAYSLTGNDVRPMIYEASEVRSAPIFDSITSEGNHVAGDRSWLSRHLHGLEAA
ncbi:nucleotidyltransferase domain-containing protein [Paenarthrobacter aurescens]|uniref:nucleotidyltransferase domain-containing protein n=1 Tax=Paenarthrobacter aurescens TaxID=43663 RepID=UPI0021C1ED0A|nr:nucleotidyltransferase domain-containing protein [Paenarthrobacter aurescens]MCT9872082.1 nucleotidyltransferase domain-containing protein [Paenarthrobacter aurescens]